MDFMSDQLFDGTRLRILTSVDVFTRLSPAIEARRSYRSDDVVDTLERVTRKYGVPKEIRVDNGPEFISRALDLWAYERLDAGLLQAREAHGQRLCGELQWQISG